MRLSLHHSPLIILIFDVKILEFLFPYIHEFTCVIKNKRTRNGLVMFNCDS